MFLPFSLYAFYCLIDYELIAGSSKLSETPDQQVTDKVIKKFRSGKQFPVDAKHRSWCEKEPHP